MASRITARRLHHVATCLVGAQLLVWTLTGFAFTCFDFRIVRGIGGRRPPAPLKMGEARLPLAEAIERARGGLPPAAAALGRVREVKLRTLLEHPVYVVSLEAERSVVIDARDGHLRASLRPEEAAQIALAEFNGETTVARVDLISNPHEASDLMVPVYRVTLADPRSTEVFIDPTTGEIVAWRNAQWRWFDRLWSLHVLGYVNRDNPAHLAMQILSGLALLVVLSGAVLLVGTMTRRREAQP